jgi:hypothetical protein
MIGIRQCLVMVLAISAAACAARAADGRPAPGRSGQTELSYEDIRNSPPARNLFDLINRERPHWLNRRSMAMPTSSRTPSDGGDVVVYRDGIRMGGAVTLRDIPTDIVESVRFLSGSEAASRFGLNHQYGAILVLTRKN